MCIRDSTRSVQATIDFARGGQFIKKANYWIPFLNAAAEGTKIPVRAMFTQRSGKTAAAAKAATLAGGVGGLTWYNSTFKEYWDVDAWWIHGCDGCCAKGPNYEN